MYTIGFVVFFIVIGTLAFVRVLEPVPPVAPADEWQIPLIFRDLTPRETVQVADRVAQLHNGQGLGELVFTDLEEGDVAQALRLTQAVRASLRADGLPEGLA